MKRTHKIAQILARLAVANQQRVAQTLATTLQVQQKVVQTQPKVLLEQRVVLRTVQMLARVQQKTLIHATVTKISSKESHKFCDKKSLLTRDFFLRID